MGQLVDGVGLEFHALEVDQVEFDFVGAVEEGEIGDEHVQEGGFAGAGLARHQHVLGGAAADVQVLQRAGASGAERCAQTLGAVALLPGVGGRSHALEGHFDLAGRLGCRAHGVDRCG